MNEDLRIPFADAVAAFKKFATEQGWPTQIVWIAQDRILIRRGSVWIFRPNELTDDYSARCFYEAARESDSSLKLFGIGEIDGLLVAGVEDMPAPLHDPKLFYMSLAERHRYTIRPITSQAIWLLLSVFPMLKRDRWTYESFGIGHTIPTANKTLHPTAGKFPV
jgi:hypothetical protein